MTTFDYEFRALEIDERALLKAIESAGSQLVNAFDTQRMGDLLSPEPGPVKYPIQWTSEKQRRAFFATDGFGKGIPTKRRGKLGKSWVMTSEHIFGGVELLVANKAPYAQYVIGKPPGIAPMQGFHRNTGWLPVEGQQEPFAQKVLGEAQTIILAELQQTVLIKEI